ncbi:hypothetical protein B0T16DRAFT_337135 [Cercophora newfieldiana]|uniref:Uncharacterized protein n=1 Tax=Cercophora newfieldiana TaxID=92897 RepID=A0AA39XU04_9PEZI|nr:hypothetical protein B0T16DRAFT_337135 [Cercophora newfieldiana]
MTNKYTITITNGSGAKETYALFNQVPQVTGLDQGMIWSNVVVTQNAAPGQQVTFEIVNDYHAIVGQQRQSDDGTFSVGSQGSVPVSLGQVQADGTVVPGTTLSMVVEDDTPQFAATPLPNSSAPNSFEIQTGDFDAATAKHEGYIIGLGPAKVGGHIHGPSATFTPEPRTTYQIHPTNTYYVAAGSYVQGALIDVTHLSSQTAVVDFTKQTDYEIFHSDHGVLAIQVDSD